MAEKQVTRMLIKVELACEKCRKKIKKVLCDIPQIQDQVYNEKDNAISITVVCCSPEKVKKKICCRGGKTVKGIEILKPKPKPPLPDKNDKPEPPLPDKNDKPKPPAPVHVPEKPAPEPVHVLALIGCPPQPPVRTCCRECYEGYGGGPCWGGGYGGPPGPCYGRPVYDSWGGGYCRPIYPSRCSIYICEENPNAACSIM